MNPATYKVTIRTDQVNEEGRSAVRIRITRGRSVKYYHTGIYLKLHAEKRKSEWNPDAEREKQNWVTSRHFDHAACNDRIDAILKGLKQVEALHPAYTAGQIRDGYGQPETTRRRGFVAFAEEWIRRKHQLGQHGTASSYVTYLSYFRRFWDGRPDEPHLLTRSAVADLVHHMRTCPTKKENATGYSPSTINNALRIYRSLFRAALLEGWIDTMPNPFDVPPVKGAQRTIQRPGSSEIVALRQLPGLTLHQRHVRNLFLMQFYLNGARISEAYTLKWADIKETYISYIPVKRAKAAKRIPRHEGIEWVLGQYERGSGYVFPFWDERKAALPGEALVNMHKQTTRRIAAALQRIGKLAGLPHLTSHMQRHAFADYIWEKTKDIKVVQAMLGHSNSNTTDRYMTGLGHMEKDALNISLYAELQVNNRETITDRDRFSGGHKPAGKGHKATKKPSKGL